MEESLNHLKVAWDVVSEDQFGELGWARQFLDREAQKWLEKGRDLSSRIDGSKARQFNPMTAPKGKQK